MRSATGDENRLRGPSIWPMTDRQLWCRAVLVGRRGEEVGLYTLEGYGGPDLTAVEVVARLDLLAGRQGGRVILADVSAAMARLLELAGLGVEMKGQAEGGKEPGGV